MTRKTTILTMTFMATLMLIPAGMNASAQTFDVTGLKAYYTFDGSSGTLINQATQANSPDGLGSSVDGIITGFLTQGSSWSDFSTSDYVTIPSGINVDWTNTDWTITGWAKTENTSPYAFWISNRDGSSTTTNGYFSIGTHSGNFEFNYGGGQAAASSTSADTDWHHYVMVHSSDANPSGSSTAKLYIDGILEAESSTGSNNKFGDSTDTVIIGGAIPFNEMWDGGSVDEISIWNRVLTESEISTLYNNGNMLNLLPESDPEPTITELQSQITILNSTVIQQGQEIATLQSQITSLNATNQSQQQEIDHLYLIWEQIRDTIINWLAGRP